MLSGRTGLTVLLALALWRAAPGAQWTVAVYMCADNGMNDQAYADLAEMTGVGSTGEVNVVVQADRVARDSNPGCRRYAVHKDRLELLDDLGEVDMADTATLAEFGSFVKSRFPAKNYFLVLWDHGNGWSEGYGPSRAIFIDDSRGHMMGVAGGDLSAAVAGFRRALGTRVKVLGFDACLMGMMEVACEVREDCDYMVASEGLVPWGGWQYGELLATLTAQPTKTPADFLPELCNGYVAQYPDDDVCLSGLDMRQLDRALPVIAATVKDSLVLPAAGFHEARAQVQTFSPVAGRPPGQTDEQVDFIHYWQLASVAESLDRVMERLVTANAASATLAHARGIACWFPDNYLAMKGARTSYAKLSFADTVPWLGFLNAYFGTDDVKPTRPVIAEARVNGHGDVRLWWNRAEDLAPVSYDLYEAAGLEETLLDNCENLDRWVAVGWTLGGEPVHSGSRAFFSGSGANLDNWIAMATPIGLSHGGLLSCYVFYSTEETWDSAGGFRRDVCCVEWSNDRANWHVLDSLYGSAPYWQELRYVMPPANPVYLRFHYVTNGSNNGRGVFLDDIKVYSFETVRVAARSLAETTAYVYNLPRDTAGYHYAVTATDSFGNVSMASQFSNVVKVKDWAEPYTRPAPFSGPCQLVLDFPEGETPDVLVYTLSGVLVWKHHVTERRPLDWDGRNESKKELADGLYIVSVVGRTFHRLGKIAKVRR
jgi:hypothetical protein